MIRLCGGRHRPQALALAPSRGYNARVMASKTTFMPLRTLGIQAAILLALLSCDEGRFPFLGPEGQDSSSTTIEDVASDFPQSIDLLPDESRPAPEIDPDCEPDCRLPNGKLKVCGPDGCGGACGDCPLAACVDNVCLCMPQCAGSECGPDGCGGDCGKCEVLRGTGWSCDIEKGICMPPCQPNCDPPGQPTCDLIVDCAADCGQSDQACFQNCLDAAPPEVLAAYEALVGCLDSHGYFQCLEDHPDDDPQQSACVQQAQEQCKAEYYACWPPGDGSCGELYICLIWCPEGDDGPQCTQDCFDSTSEQGMEAWNALIDCMSAVGYFDCASGDSDCYQQAWDDCDLTFKECAHGDLTCAEIVECQDQCPPAGTVCRLECMLGGTIEAQLQFDAITDCITETCGLYGTMDCEHQALQGACSQEHLVCVQS